MLKLLVVADSPTVSTGFGRVSNELLKRLHKKYEVTVLGINHFGEPYSQQKFPYQIYPVDKANNPEALYGYSKLWWLAKKVVPDVILVINDPWIINEYMENKPDDFRPYTKFICYYPVDGAPIKKEWVDRLNNFDAQICYSNYAERVVIDSNGGKKPKNLYQIYHGVNTKNYFPVNQSMARAALGIPTDLFIVGMVARNQYRKRFDLLMKGFADFAKDKPKAKLYLHTALKDQGYDLVDLSKQLGLNKDKLIITEGLTPGGGVEEDRLNIIYNTFDVNANITLGEGFGLSVAESMATGCPQLVSDHSTPKELIEGSGAGLLVDNAASILNLSGINTWGIISDTKDITKKLNVLYKNEQMRIDMTQKAYTYITQDKFNWDIIADKFDSIIKGQFNILRREEWLNGLQTQIRKAG